LINMAKKGALLGAGVIGLCALACSIPLLIGGASVLSVSAIFLEPVELIAVGVVVVGLGIWYFQRKKKSSCNSTSCSTDGSCGCKSNSNDNDNNKKESFLKRIC
jgi:hypothetical protein